MTADEDDDTGDLLIGLNRIASHLNLSHEGVRHLWAQGRVPVVKFGSFWIGNKSALTKAFENNLLRTRRGRKTDAERAEIEAIRTEAEQAFLNLLSDGKQAYSPEQNLKSEAKPKLVRKPPTKAKAKPKTKKG
jgi:hypothetical protein